MAAARASQSALLAAALVLGAAVVACGTMLPLQATPRVDVGQQLPPAYLVEKFRVCGPEEVTGGKESLMLGDYTGKVLVVGTYYVGCNPGRTDAPTYSALAAKLSVLPPTAGRTGFIATLKGGVNDARCGSWANLNGSTPGFPTLVDDEDRSLLYKLFEDRHPEYVVIDHCGTVAARVGALAEPESNEEGARLNAVRLEEIVESLAANLSAACPSGSDAAPSGGAGAREMARGDVPVAPIKAPPTVATCGAQQQAAAFAAQSVLVASGASHKLAKPRTVTLNPLVSDELWVGNHDTDGVSVISLDPATGVAVPDASLRRRDRAPYHYMDRMSQLAFDPRGFFATCQESTNNYEGMMQANLFMGPTMYHADPSVMVTQRGEPCAYARGESADGAERCYFLHSDMLHESPLCMGITHDSSEQMTPYQNVYWAFDGLNNTLVRYDFEKPHGPGYLDHSLATVRRYPEIELKREPGVVGHLQIDDATRILYVADTGNGRVVAVAADSGRFNKTARQDLGGDYVIWSSLNSTFEYSLYACVAQYDLVSDVAQPSGIAVASEAGIVFVAEHGSGHIIALRAHGRDGTLGGEEIARFATGAGAIMGLNWDSDNERLYYVDAERNEVRFVTVDICNSVSEAGTEADADAVLASFPAVECAAENGDLGIAIDHVTHDDGYQNTTMMGPEYGLSTDCPAINNDMLLMSGYLCHACLPDVCNELDQGKCTNVLGKGYYCTCSNGWSGDDCHIAPPEDEPVCGGHGWVMGEGAAAHCMCEDGYGYPSVDQPLSCAEGGEYGMADLGEHDGHDQRDHGDHEEDDHVDHSDHGDHEEDDHADHSDHEEGGEMSGCAAAGGMVAAALAMSVGMGGAFAH